LGKLTASRMCISVAVAVWATHRARKHVCAALPTGKRLQAGTHRTPLQSHSCNRRNNSSRGNWMLM